MCGIAGILTDKPDVFQSIDRSATVLSMLERIRHRGPDESGLFINDHAAIGTVRLSIIDVQNGQQPMKAHDRYVINYNGEVFNYIELRKELEDSGETFITQSDTEVVLKALIAWGPDALQRFDGHFAISFYDTYTRELLLARDPFGEKPLFYTRQDGLFAFGSEVKVFQDLPGFSFDLDKSILSHAAWFWTPLSGEAVFKKVKSVRPGHFLRVGSGKLESRRYFDFPALSEETESQKINYNDAQAELRTLMTQSIQRRLRSDVEVGAYLSGGLDSTIVTCMAREQVGEKLKTFSVAFDHPDYDESEFQECVAEALGAEHHTVKIGAQDIVSDFEEALFHTETAVFRTAFVPMYVLSKSVQDKGIKVVLTGEGSDEFFMGYDVFKETLFRENYESYANDSDRIEAILNLYPYLSHFDAQGAAGLLQYFKNYLDHSDPFFSHALRFSNGTLASQIILEGQSRKEADADFLENLHDTGHIHYKDLSKLAQAQVVDTTTLLEGYLLSSQGDRMTSAHSVEGRCPFLSVDIARFAQKLPLKMKLSGGTEKKILRDAFADSIPKSSLMRRKQPYRAPDAAPFIQNKEFLQDVICNDLLRNTNIVNAGLAQRLINKLQKSGSEKISPREDQAFIFMLSTLLLEQRFCKAEERLPIRMVLKVKIDETGRRKTI